MNPSDGVMADIKRKAGKNKGSDIGAAKGFYGLYRKQSGILPLAPVIHGSVRNRVQDWGSDRAEVG